VEPFVIFLLLLVLVLVGLFVSRPFLGHWRLKGLGSHEISALLAERERTLRALTELDLDNRIGKIPPEVYSAQRASLIRTGSDILRQLDEIQSPELTSFEGPPPVPEAAGNPASMTQDEDLDDLIYKRRAARQQKMAGFCPGCGKPVFQSDQFCSACGHIIKITSPNPLTRIR
jgi:hypothetical protein